ncbi:MAG: energy transducer TonB [Terriglobia bacterium]|nr:energy transducer TonB [Terriglobia bacterium]
MAETPLYPPLPRSAHIAGTVTLRVVTDGEKVADVSVVDGQPMLARAAQENVKTWRFIKHEPTTFLTKFNFDLSPECDTKNENGTVTLSLPLEVTITVPRRSSECDPYFGLDLSEPLRVFLTGCEVDGVMQPCKNISIELDAGELKAKPQIIKEGDKTVFVVPKEFRNAKTFGVTVQTPKGGFSLAELHGSFLKGKWRIVIDHKPFQEENRYMTKGRDCIGFIHFQWSEPERIASAPCKDK